MKLTSEELAALIARVERASEPDRELACSIARVLGWVPEDGMPGADTSAPWAWCPDFTASIDAALALVERIAPCLMVVNLCEWEAKALRERGKWTCTLKRHGTQDDFTAPAGRCRHATTAPLAILSALLRALREPSNG